jgi:hypothetical protein
MPPAGLLEDIQAQANSSGEDHENTSMFSDSGIGQPTPPPARRKCKILIKNMLLNLFQPLVLTFYNF